MLEFFIDELIRSGVTYIPPYSDTTESAADSAIDVSRPGEEEEKEKEKEGGESIKQRRRSSVTRKFSLARKSSSGLQARKLTAHRKSTDDCKLLLFSSWIRNS